VRGRCRRETHRLHPGELTVRGGQAQRRCFRTQGEGFLYDFTQSSANLVSLAVIASLPAKSSSGEARPLLS